MIKIKLFLIIFSSVSVVFFIINCSETLEMFFSVPGARPRSAGPKVIPPPSGGEASDGISDKFITITWGKYDHNELNTDGFEIQRSTFSNKKFKKINPLVISEQSSFEDINANDENLYYYKIMMPYLHQHL